mmetsp:Transcript_37899/g.80668  ORF Transcript_37899/g.80668 Transcript_37899/m.80668 type:complete len:239 (+) Transcript_37899:258-974(+)
MRTLPLSSRRHGVVHDRYRLARRVRRAQPLGTRAPRGRAVGVVDPRYISYDGRRIVPRHLRSSPALIRCLEPDEAGRVEDLVIAESDALHHVPARRCCLDMQGNRPAFAPEEIIMHLREGAPPRESPGFEGLSPDSRGRAREHTWMSRMPPAVSEPMETPMPVRKVLNLTVTLCVEYPGNASRARALSPDLIATWSSPTLTSQCSMSTCLHESGSTPSTLGAYSGARILRWWMCTCDE